LDFNENEIAVLTAVNGKGKTTIISHIVDALYEMARPYYEQEFENKENKLYRVSSSLFNLDQRQTSYVYLRFKAGEDIIDYIDIRNNCTQEQYDRNIVLENKIPFDQFQPSLANQDM
jgi:predicted ATP-binding protein involved in virulence